MIGSAVEYHGVSNGDGEIPLLSFDWFSSVNFVETAALVRKIGMTIIPGKAIVSIALVKEKDETNS